jgi:beta-glucanase (GH16 family)
MSLLRLTTLLIFAAALPAATLPEPRLVLEENFDGPELDPKIWNIETGKRRDAVNSPKSVDLREGRLVITTWTDTDGTTYCGFVTTRNKFTVVAGKAEARLRFAAEPGTQICFWAQSPTYGRSGEVKG